MSCRSRAIRSLSSSRAPETLVQPRGCLPQPEPIQGPHDSSRRHNTRCSEPSCLIECRRHSKIQLCAEFRSTSRHCCLRLRGMCSCLVLDPCRRLDDACLDSANWNRDLPACNGTLPFGEWKGSGPCNRSLDSVCAPEGVAQTQDHMSCRLQSLTQYEREAKPGSGRDDQDRRFALPTHRRTRFARRTPGWRTARP